LSSGRSVWVPDIPIATLGLRAVPASSCREWVGRKVAVDSPCSGAGAERSSYLPMKDSKSRNTHVGVAVVAHQPVWLLRVYMHVEDC
jgi:hypothetical protein